MNHHQQAVFLKMQKKIQPIADSCTPAEKEKVLQVMEIFSEAIDELRGQPPARKPPPNQVQSKPDWLDHVINVCTFGAWGKGIR